MNPSRFYIKDLYVDINECSYKQNLRFLIKQMKLKKDIYNTHIFKNNIYIYIMFAFFLLANES